MATSNGGRMVALFLCLLFANVSFAQGGSQTVIVYMEDPIPVEEQLAPEAREYLDKLNDPFTWETEQDFQDARDAQIAQVARDNEARIRAAERFLEGDLERSGGTSSWYPSWIPLGSAETREDSLFKNALNLRGGRPYITGPRAGQRQSVREFFELDGQEPYEASPGGFRTCDETKPRCRKEFYFIFRDLVDKYEESLVSPDPISPSLLFPALIWPSLWLSPPSLLLPDAPSLLDESISPIAAPRIISFTIKAAASTSSSIGDSLGFVDELNEEGNPGELSTFVRFDFDSIRLLQPAAIDPDSLSFHVRPAAKPASSSKISSWGRIKETFAD